jgi:hypothetical protein
LGLELDDPDDHSVLSEFRHRTDDGDRADRLLSTTVDRLVATGLLKRHGLATHRLPHVLAAGPPPQPGDLVAETLRCALEELAVHAEEWLAGLVTQEWADRYGWPVRYDRDCREVARH